MSAEPPPEPDPDLVRLDGADAGSTPDAVEAIDLDAILAEDRPSTPATTPPDTGLEPTPRNPDLDGLKADIAAVQAQARQRAERERVERKRRERLFQEREEQERQRRERTEAERREWAHAERERRAREERERQEAQQQARREREEREREREEREREQKHEREKREQEGQQRECEERVQQARERQTHEPPTTDRQDTPVAADPHPTETTAGSSPARMLLVLCGLAALTLIASLAGAGVWLANRGADARAQMTVASDHAPVTRPEWADDFGRDTAGWWATLTVAGTPFRFRHIPAGSFLMGSPADEPERYRNETAHPVTITRPFWLAANECTQAQYRALMDANPSLHVGDDHPVEHLSWAQARELARCLAQTTGAPARLPSEAEWEYACRAGTPTPTSAANAVSGDADGSHRPVATRRANPWGLYDMQGNVHEWVRDHGRGLPPYAPGPARDPSTTDDIGPRTVYRYRGGAWNNTAADCRCARRYGREGGDAYPSIGVRLAIDG